MKIVFVSNFINHHQVHVADELYKLCQGNYWFIETNPISEAIVNTGYPIFSRPYLIKTYEGIDQLQYAEKIIDEADAVVIGDAPNSFVINRIQKNKLTFRYSERWFKSRPWFLTGPRGWINLYRNHIRFRNNPLYMLCASAYTAGDVNRIGAYKNKCFKWGYFTKVEDFDVETLINGDSDRILQIMWCARFLNWKHPELPVKLAARLKSKGYKFIINMFGSGEEFEVIKNLAKKLNVEDVVNFCGNKPNDEILSEMRRHDIFLFTSDRNEGWGAVLNEAMSNGCAVVGSDEIGSVPFLIEDGVNGYKFKSRNLDSLEKKVVYLIENPNVRLNMAKNAYHTMSSIWSPANAARQFIRLVDSLIVGDENNISNIGPGSKI